MSWDPQRRSELEELLAELRDDQLSAAGALRLESLLAESGEAREQYLQLMELHAELHWRFALSHSPEDAAAAASDAAPTAPRSSWSQRLFRYISRPGPFSTTVAALVIGLLITAMAFIGAPIYKAMRRSDRTETPPPVVVAEITNLHDAVFAKEQFATYRGAHLLAGHRLQLVEGFAEITYGEDGPRVIIEGPATFDVDSAAAGTLDNGKLAAFVPPAAVGFIVATQAVDIKDLGTQFGVRLDPNGALEVSVIEGRVALEPGKRLAQRQIITAGQSWRLDADATQLAAAPFDASQFVLELPEPSDHPQSYQAWQAFQEAVRHDPDLIAYYTFERDPADAARLANRAAGAVASDGEILAADWTSGRWTDKGALHFGGQEQMVRVDIPGEYAAVTIAAWVKFDGEFRSNCALLMSDGNDAPGSTHWLTDHLGNGLQFTVLESGGVTPAAKGLPARRWNLLAVTCDRDSGQVREYINGREIGRGAIAPNKRPGLTFGAATIGNWMPSKQRPLRGAIDELFVFNRVLTPAEIRGLVSLNASPFGLDNVTRQ